MDFSINGSGPPAVLLNPAGDQTVTHALKGPDFVRNGSPKYACLYDDFLTNPAQWAFFNLGSPSGGNADYITDVGDPNHPGILRINTGTVSGSGMGFWNGNFGPGPGYANWTLESTVSVYSLTSGFAFGFFNSQIWGTTNSACYFMYDSTISPNWLIQALTHQYDSGVAVAANTFTKLTFTNDGTNIYFYINGVLVQTVSLATIGLGPGSGRLGGMCITRSAVTAYGDWDYILYSRGPLTR